MLSGTERQIHCSRNSAGSHDRSLCRRRSASVCDVCPLNMILTALILGNYRLMSPEPLALHERLANSLRTESQPKPVMRDPARRRSTRMHGKRMSVPTHCSSARILSLNQNARTQRNPTLDSISLKVSNRSCCVLFPYGQSITVMKPSLRKTQGTNPQNRPTPHTPPEAHKQGPQTKQQQQAAEQPTARASQAKTARHAKANDHPPTHKPQRGTRADDTTAPPNPAQRQGTREGKPTRPTHPPPPPPHTQNPHPQHPPPPPRPQPTPPPSTNPAPKPGARPQDRPHEETQDNQPRKGETQPPKCTKGHGIKASPNPNKGSTGSPPNIGRNSGGKRHHPPNRKQAFGKY